MGVTPQGVVIPACPVSAYAEVPSAYLGVCSLRHRDVDIGSWKLAGSSEGCRKGKNSFCYQEKLLFFHMLIIETYV